MMIRRLVVATVAVLVCALTMDASAQWPDGRPLSFEGSANRPGGDYARIVMPERNPLICVARCQQDQRCQAFTFVHPGPQGPQPICYLYDGRGLSGGNQHGVAVSGRRY